MPLANPVGLPTHIASVAPGLPFPAARGVLWQAGPGQFLLSVPGVARYLVTDGQTITIDPAPGATEADINRFLQMTPLAALYFQRGRPVFHAAACTLNGRAILLAGDSGAGKSTLLAALLQRGWTMLADDLALVELNDSGAPAVRPNPAPLCLWPEARQKLGPLPAEAGIPGASSSGVPVSAIYWLSVHSGNRVETETVTGAARFSVLNILLYNSHIADALLDRAAYLVIAGKLIQTVPIIHLRRPRGQWSIPALIDAIAQKF